MGYENGLTLASSVIFLGLAGLSALRGKQNPLARALGLVCADFFGYTTLSFLYTITEDPTWRWRERAAASLASPLTLHLILAFVGARRRHRYLLAASYLYFGSLALICAGRAFPALEGLIESSSWARSMLIGMVPVFVTGAVLVVRHYQRERSSEERMRTQLMIGALALGVGGGATDLIALAGAIPFPRLSSIGLVLSAVVLSAVVHRFRLVEGRIGLALLNSIVIAAVGVVVQVGLFVFFGAKMGLLAVGTLVVLVGVIAAARPTFTAITKQRERTSYLVTLGRLSAQMAHDVRNPLSAIRGAAQFLEEEAAQGRPLGDQLEMLRLMVEQTDRLETVIADYHRYGRVEPELQSVSMNDVVHGALRACEVSASGDAVRVEREFAADLPTCSADPDLVSGALENLIRNACEAMPTGGTLWVRTELVTAASGAQVIRITVQDSGRGMDPRTQEQAFESFFTTKDEGTGLGLPFVRRVAEVHGGRVELESQLGEGTAIAIDIEVRA